MYVADTTHPILADLVGEFVSIMGFTFWYIVLPYAGASEAEVACMGTLTANLHLMINTFYKPTASRYKILCETKAFPSDQVCVTTCPGCLFS